MIPHILSIVFFVLALTSDSFAIEISNDQFEVTEIEFEGNGKTKIESLIEILPRNLPTKMSYAEIAEYSRRIKNLGIFESVNISKVGNRLLVKVNRKKTLSPIIGLSSGKTLKDSTATIGLNEYDFLGNGTKIGGQVSYSDRNLNFTAWIDEHIYRHNRWAREVEVYRLSSDFRFENNEDITWQRNRMGGFLELVSPFQYESPIYYEFQFQFYREDYSNTSSSNFLESATYLGSLFEIVYDRYNWDDLYPNGFKGVLEMRPGIMSNENFRGEVVTKLLAATPLTDRTTLVVNGKAAIVNSGDVNHSLLIGSQTGVRGLDDSLYRNSALSFLNVEARHSIRMWEGIFLQPVIFVDAARFRPMNADGKNEKWLDALSTGVGVRIVPTGLTNVLIRTDLARLHTPSDDWLLQFGITQYF